MGVSIALDHACGRCGEQVILSVQTDGGSYTHDLAALLEAGPGESLFIRAMCGCSHPRQVALEGASLPPVSSGE
jgi:hypothetical protein